VQVNPPINVTGCVSSDSFLLQQDLLNSISWSAPLVGSNPVSYQLYQDADLSQLIAIVSATGTLSYIAHNRKPNTTYSYYIVSVDQNGDHSIPVEITITRPC
jgi:hypothetical protein